MGVIVLVLGAGPRCGSTLMQRLISSHPEAFIWGEYTGQFAQLLGAVECLVQHSDRLGEPYRKEFAEYGYQGFMANLMPESEVVARAFRAFCAELFNSAGARVWGFKEVRYDLQFVTRLQRLLSGVRVIFLVRDPRDVLCSLDEWERDGWPRTRSSEAIRHWQRIATSFLRTTSIPVLPLRYEDFSIDSEGTAHRVAEFVGLDPAGFDLSVFDRKVHNLGGVGDRQLRRWDDLPADVRQLALDPAVRTTAKAYHYLYD